MTPQDIATNIMSSMASGTVGASTNFTYSAYGRMDDSNSWD